MNLPKSFSSTDGIFDGYNRTELLQVCHEAGLRLHPSTPREEMVEYLLGTRDYNESRTNELDAWRHGIMGFLTDHWAVVSTQLKCPAKSGDPLSCFQCVDTQVACCLVEQRTYLTQIRNHKKEERRNIMSEVVTLENCPRDVDAIAAINFIQVRRVVAELENAGVSIGADQAEIRAFYGIKDTTERAKKVLAALLQYDEKNPGTENEQAAAPPAAKKTATREPATSSKKKTSGEAQPSAGGATQVFDMGPVLDAIAELSAKVEAQTKIIAEMQGNQVAIGQLVEYGVGVCVTTAEAAMNCPWDDDLAAQAKEAGETAFTSVVGDHSGK